MKNFIVKGNICYSTFKDEIKTIESGYIVVENGLSKGVFKSIPEKYKDYHIYDYGDNLVIPGMCDMHIHAPQYTFRGTGMDLELLEWLNGTTFDEESKFSDEDYAKKAYEIFVEQMKKSATTRACIFATIHKNATKILMDLLEESGLVTYVGKVNMDRNSPECLTEKDYLTSYKNTISWLEEIKGKYKNTRAILTPRFTPSCSKELLEKLGEIQEEYNIPVQSHLSENINEVKWVKELEKDCEFYGETYDRYHLFGGKNNSGKNVKTIMAHCVLSDEKERKLLKDRGVYIAHCPFSNVNLTSGIAPIRTYVDMGAKVTLGSDVAGGHTESMFSVIVNAIQMSKMYKRYVDGSKKALTFEEAFYFATKQGGEFFDKTGSFEEGYQFDAVVLNDKVVPFVRDLTLRQRLERAVYISVDMLGIKAKFVNGTQII